MPVPYTAAMAVGLTPPACPPAALKKLELVICGPGSRTVRVNETVNWLTEAVTVNVPGVDPACAVIEARPWESVVAIPLLGRIIPPLAVNRTCTPEAGPWLLVAVTT